MRLARASFLSLASWCLLANTETALAQGRDTTVVVGPQYRAGGLHRWIFGGNYRRLWTLPIRAPVLDLATFGQGLTPTTAGGGLQTLSLRFDGADGYKYGFRSIDKDPDVLDQEFQGTVIEDVVQDQISSAHPAGPAIAVPLMAAAGIYHTDPQLVVLPDDPLLGQHRERFAGAVGYIEARAVVEPGVPPFAGATEIIGDDEIFTKVRSSNRHRVDTRALLTARLLDMLIGDWDRHRGQWTWARFGNGSITRWIPIPEDRDQAFVRYDGLAMSIARLTTPQLVKFSAQQPSVIGLNWNGREIDRQFLSDLARPVWDSIAETLQTVWTDAVIDDAVRAMPPEYYEESGQDLATTLVARRDWLKEFAGKYYGVLAAQPDVHGSDDRDVVTITRDIDGSAHVVMARADGSAFFDRRFDPDETREIRLYLYGGDDHVAVRGGGASAITIRIVVAEGDNTIENTSGASGVRIYDSAGVSKLTGDGISLDRRAYTPPPRPPGNSPPHRDWGTLWRFLAWGSFSPDLGVFVGGGAYRTSYGFRAVPFATHMRMRGGWAFAHERGNVEVRTTWHTSNTRRSFHLISQLSGVEITRFHGLGNETPASAASRFYRVNQVQFQLLPEFAVSLSPALHLALGAEIKYTNTRDRPGTLLTDSLSGIYGDDKFGQVGGAARLVLDTRESAGHPTHGIHLELRGRYRPQFWDVDSTAFGELYGSASTYLTAARAPLAPSLAVRAGARKVFGTYPFMEAAFIGDAQTVRLGRQNRFAGDAAVWGNVELRIRFGEIFVLLPQHAGAFGLFDVGRVFLDGENSNRWHTAYGGGLWIAPLSRDNTISVAWAQSDDRGGLYIQSGFAF